MATTKSNARPKSKALVAAAGYVRMSTDQQDASPERQRAEILQLAERMGYRIARWYEDHGLTGTESDNRPEFQRMLRDARQGTFRAILMYEQSRFSREDVFDVIQHWKTLRAAGVEIVTCGRGKLDFGDLGGLITAIVDQHGAHDESVKIANRSVSGKLNKLRNGKRVSGTATFGFDRLIRDETGREVRRVHFRERFTKPRNWTQELVPSSDVEAVDAIRWAFQQIAAGTRANRIAMLLNERGVKSRDGLPWTATTIKQTLSNPVYAGILRAGIYSKGKFRKLSEEGAILKPGAHVGLVTPNLFYTVQDRLKAVCGSRSEKAEGRYLLSGLVYCDFCGVKMYGRLADGLISYSCVKSPRRGDPGCPRPHVSGERLERFVIEMLRERILCDENRDSLMEAVKRWQSDRGRSFEQDQLDEVRRKIERGTENLALAEGENFLAISNLLERWRAEESELEKRIARDRSRNIVRPEALAALEMLSEFRENLDGVDRVALSAAVRNTIREIRIKTERFGLRDCKFSGVVHFHPNVCCDGSIPFTHDEIAVPRLWAKAAELIRASNRPLTVKDVSALMDLKSRGSAHRHIREAVARGLVAQHPSKEGFIRAEDYEGAILWKKIPPLIAEHGPLSATELTPLLGLRHRSTCYPYLEAAIAAGEIKKHPERRGRFALAR